MSMEEFHALRGQREGELEEDFFSRMASILRLWLAYLVASHRRFHRRTLFSFLSFCFLCRTSFSLSLSLRVPRRVVLPAFLHALFL